VKTVIQVDQPTTLTIENTTADSPAATPATPCTCLFTGCKYVPPEVTPLEPVEMTATAFPTVDEIAHAVVARLLGGKGIVEVDGTTLPDDLGVPPALRLGLPLQNYLTWAGRMGAAWALQDPNVLLTLAAILTAMAKAGADPQAQARAAAAARDALQGGK